MQTIMDMARASIILVSYSWSKNGANNFALWEFAVKHAIWISNCVPNHLSGLTPMELLTMTKAKANHHDLLYTNVWGYPVNVIDSMLQDGQLIPEWNCQPCTGQFLGFSDAQSFFVTNVCHLLLYVTTVSYV